MDPGGLETAAALAQTEDSYVGSDQSLGHYVVSHQALKGGTPKSLSALSGHRSSKLSGKNRFALLHKGGQSFLCLRSLEELTKVFALTIHDFLGGQAETLLQ